jgi:hypothetical protein
VHQVRPRVSDSIIEYRIAETTKIHVLRLDSSEQPDFVLLTEEADDAPIRDATRARETNISAQRECGLTMGCFV